MAFDAFPDALVFDRSSARSRDEDGRMRVAATNISKANVCPYRGREIPRYQELGLEPDKIYQMFRDPEELARGAETFNGVQLMEIHIPVTAFTPQKERVVGAVNNVFFDPPYLKADLALWDGQAIQDVEDERKRELSCSYRYDADMTPGEHNGLRFDGVMRNIRGNHVALVTEGRAGPDVLVGDSKETIKMPKPLNSRKALMLSGALRTALAPVLAADAKIDFGSILDGVTAKTMPAMRRTVLNRLAEATKGKLVGDAKLDGCVLAFDAMEQEAMDGEEDDMGADESEEDKAAREKKEAADKKAKDKKAMDKRAKDRRAMDAEEASEREKCKAAEDKRRANDGEDPETSEEEEARERKEANDRKRARDAKAAAMDAEKDESEQDKNAAMDAAINTAVTSALVGERARTKALTQALTDVQPHVGTGLTFDSAEDVYRFALDQAEVDAPADASLAALKAMVGMLKPPGRTDYRANDSAFTPSSRSDAGSMFPELRRIGRA